MTYGFSRRFFLSLIPPASLAGQKPVRRTRAPLPRVGEFSRYLDAQTEQPVTRLTALSSASYFPPSANRISPPKDRFLLFASDRDGDLAPYTMDLRTGVATQVADTAQLDLNSLQLSASGRSVYFIDGGMLTETGVQSRKSTGLMDGVTAFSPGPTPGEFLFVRDGKLFLSGKITRRIATDVANYCMVRPGNAGCLVLRRDGAELWYVAFREGSSQSVKLADGQPAGARWSPDGGAILFLRAQTTDNGTQQVAIFEVSPEGGPASEKLVAKTSRYACFAPNNDASVFVGASMSKAQPSILLLVRSVGRELTLCEHRTHDVAHANPSFSPDNRRVYFASDFQERPAIYAVNVESLVEPAAS